MSAVKIPYCSYANVEKPNGRRAAFAFSIAVSAPPPQEGGVEVTADCIAIRVTINDRQMVGAFVRKRRWRAQSDNGSNDASTREQSA